MKTITAALALILAACQPVVIAPVAPGEPVASREPTPEIEQPNTTPETPVVDTDPETEPDPTPTLNPHEFYLPTYIVRADGSTGIHGCPTRPQWQANIGLYKVQCYLSNGTKPAYMADWIRDYLTLQGLVEDVHYEVDAYSDRAIIYLLDTEYKGLNGEAFDAR